MNELIEALEAWERYEDRRVMWEQVALTFTDQQMIGLAKELARLHVIAREKTKDILAKVRS